MTVRPATDADIPLIISLLRKSLGESLTPKSERFWRWKHIENPFGKSPVLLAHEGSELIGVRAFMRWQWQNGNRMFKAVRAVDTATHPKHQGKGVFKELTMQLLEECKEEGVDFIFNTPNKSSMPGYLKMGWNTVGRLPLRMKLHLFRRKKARIAHADADQWELLEANPVFTSIAKTSHIVTAMSPAYLRWRYLHNPNVNYHMLSSDGEHPFVIIFRLKTSKNITEVRITELLTIDSIGRRLAFKELAKRIDGISIISISHGFGLSDVYAGFFPIPIGPVVTARNLNMRDWPESLSFANWSPSLGDLELF